MKRIYHHFSSWEDCKSGILKTNFDEIQTEKLTIKAKQLLCSPKKFYEVALEVISKWIYSSEQHLSNKGRNRQAWIGQASCCYKYKIPEHITKYAWRMMTKEQQKEANAIADDIIKLWEERNAKELS